MKKQLAKLRYQRLPGIKTIENLTFDDVNLTRNSQGIASLNLKQKNW